jgi:hypothetical protein
MGSAWVVVRSMLGSTILIQGGGGGRGGIVGFPQSYGSDKRTYNIFPKLTVCSITFVPRPKGI